MKIMDIATTHLDDIIDDYWFIDCAHIDKAYKRKKLLKNSIFNPAIYRKRSMAKFHGKVFSVWSFTYIQPYKVK